MSLLVNTFRKQVSKMKDFRMKSEVSPQVGYSTGFLSFDFMNGVVAQGQMPDGMEYSYYSVGITDGSMVMIIGRSGCGKTSWAVQAAANVVRPFPNAAIFHDDIEGGIIEERKRVLTGFTPEELQQKYIHRNTGITAENFFERVKMIHDIKMENREDYEYDSGVYDSYGKRIIKLQPTVYILDSLAMLMPEKFTEEDELSGSMAASAVAKTNTAIFKRIMQLAKTANIILFIINHITSDIAMGTPKKTDLAYLKQGEALPGGKAAVYVTNTLIRFDDNTKLKDSEGMGIDGNYVDLTLVKSRTNKAGSACTLVFDKSRGYDPDLSLLLMLKQNGRLGGAGAFLYIGDRSDMKFSQKKFKEMLYTNEEFRKAFQDECLSCLKANLDAQMRRPNLTIEQQVTMGLIESINNQNVIQ